MEQNKFEIEAKRMRPALLRMAIRYLEDSDEAEDVVQDAFVYLWENRRRINIKTSLKSYLYQSVRHGALKVIRSQTLEQRHISRLTEFIEYLEQSEFSEEELSGLQKVEQAIEELPSQCKSVFLMSLVDEKSYKQIADELGISLNTVKTHISKAYRLIREKAQNYKNISLLIWLYYKRLL